MNNQALLTPLLALAKQAGDAIMEIYQATSTEVQYKQDDSPLTKADLASHEILVKGLTALTPEIPILSEEGKDIAYGVRSHWKTFWLLDPLDGTKEFIQKNGDFTVNIALIQDGAPVLGVVYAPALRRLYYAGVGLGAFSRHADEEPRSISVWGGDFFRVTRLRLVVSRSHAGAETEAFLDKLRARFTIEQVSAGSSLKLCYVAENEAQLYPRLGPTMEWDIAAAHCIVEQAGGYVRDLHNKPLSYNKPDLHNPYFMVCFSDEVIEHLAPLALPETTHS